jgi:hypothetical protein
MLARIRQQVRQNKCTNYTMNMKSTEKNLFNNDIVIRLAAFALIASLNACQAFYFEQFGPGHRHGVFIVPMLNNFVFLWIAFMCMKTSFSQDVKEFAFFEALFYLSGYTLFLLPKSPIIDALYAHHTSAKDAVIRIIYVLFIARLFWPSKNKASGEFANWPVFGFIGLVGKLTKTGERFAPASKNQALAAYATIAAAIVLGGTFYRLGIKIAHITQAVPTIFIIGFAAKKSKDWFAKQMGEYHAAQAEEMRTKKAAQLAEEEKNKAQAEAAQLAQANTQLQATVADTKKIVFHQMEVYAMAQDEHARMRERLAALAAASASEQGVANDGDLLSEIRNPANPHYSVRLSACIAMFEHFQGVDLKGKKPKEAICKYAKENAEALGLMHNGKPSHNAAEQCAFVLNWMQEAGAPKTQARTA